MVHVQVVGVDVGGERTGVGATVDLLEHRRLDLEDGPVQQALAQRLHGGGAGPQDLAGVGAGHQVEIAAAHLRLGVGEAPALVGQRAQAFAGELPGGDEDGSVSPRSLTPTRPSAVMRSPMSTSWRKRLEFGSGLQPG